MTSPFDTFFVCTVLFVCMCVIFFLLCYSLRANELFRPWPAFIGCLSINSIHSTRFGSLSFCKKVKKIFEEKGIKVLDWPGNSLDLNPIENLWSIVKTKLLRKDSIIEAIIDIWFRDEKIAQDCRKLEESMPKRVELLTKNKSGHIAY